MAIVRDDKERVLLIHKTDNDLWALPGGGHEIGESIADTVIREVKEETGYDVELDAITGTYSSPGHVIAYEDGEVRQQFSIAFTAHVVGGDARTSNESKRVEWVPPDQVSDEAARLLMVGRPKVYQLMRMRELRSVKVGASRRISARALSDYVAGLETQDPW